MINFDEFVPDSPSLYFPQRAPRSPFPVFFPTPVCLWKTPTATLSDAFCFFFHPRPRSLSEVFLPLASLVPPGPRRLPLNNGFCPDFFFFFVSSLAPLSSVPSRFSLPRGLGDFLEERWIKFPCSPPTLLYAGSSPRHSPPIFSLIPFPPPPETKSDPLSNEGYPRFSCGNFLFFLSPPCAFFPFFFNPNSIAPSPPFTALPEIWSGNDLQKGPCEWRRPLRRKADPPSFFWSVPFFVLGGLFSSAIYFLFFLVDDRKGSLKSGGSPPVDGCLF